MHSSKGFKEAAQANIPYAQYQMAIIGLALKRNIYNANAMLERAANNGYGLAILKLKGQYKFGKYREKDLEKADYWQKRYDARPRDTNAVLSPSDEVSLSEQTVNQLQHYVLRLDEFFDAELRVLGNESSYKNRNVFELPLIYADKAQ